MKRDIAHYGDCDVFKPGERWRSPRGTNYFVEGVQVGGMATLRTLNGPWASPNEVRMGCRIGRLRMVPWDGVINWVRYAPAQPQTPQERPMTDPTSAQRQPEPDVMARRVYINNPVQIAECGGPCWEGGPEACDCGALWRDQPEPAGQIPPDYIDPQHTGADRELLQAYYAACWSEGGTVDEVTLRGLRAAIAVARAQRHPAPVPVAERLPGTEDCLDEGWAWFFSPRVGWRQAVLPVSAACTHWLPAHALPLPGEVK